MSRAEVLELARTHTVTDLVTACRAHGISKTAGYELNARGELPFKVLRLGRLIRVPTADLLRSLGLSAGSVNGTGAELDGGESR